MTRNEEADEEEVARGRDKDHGSDVVTRRLVLPGDSKRPAGFSRSAENCQTHEARSRKRNQTGNRSRILTFVTVRGVDVIRRRP